MPTSTLSHFPSMGRFRARSSFTLVELMMVICIIAILMAIGASLVPGLLKGNLMDQSVATLSGIIELARQEATSRNTPVWVAFSDPPAASAEVGTWVAIFESEDGTDPIAWATTGVTVPGTISGTPLQLVSKLQNLPGVKIVDANTLPTPLTSLAAASGISSSATLFEANLQWTVAPLRYTEGYVAPTYFTHAVEFTPDGMAHTRIWNSNIEFGVTASIANNSKNDVLINLSALTGKLTVFRP